MVSAVATMSPGPSRPRAGSVLPYVRRIDVDGEKWDLVIKPKSRPLNINLREIYRYRDLIYLMI